MKVVIFGGGSMGLAYAGLLSKVLSDVTLLVRRPEQEKAINKNGVILHTSSGKKTAKVFAVANPRDLKDADLIITLTKNYNSTQVAKIISSTAKSSCIVMTMENGIGVREIYLDKCSPRKVIQSISYLGCKRLSDTSTVVSGSMNMAIEKLDNPNEFQAQIIEALENVGFNVEISNNIKDIVWRKMILITAQHATSALTHLSFGQLLENKDSCELAEKLLKELAAVAIKEKISLPDNLMDIVQNNWKTIPDHKSSMYQDLAAGRKTEIDMMNGAIVKLGKKHGVPTPYNDALTKLIRLRQWANDSI